MTQPPGFFVGTEMPNAGWWEALWPDPASVLKVGGLEPGTRAVDLCCGDGWFTLQLARIAASVTAIDIDAALLEVARHRLNESRVTNVRFVTGDAYDLSRLIAKPVDFVFMANAFHGVPDRARLASAVRDILAPGGLFAIVNWHTRPREDTTVLGEPRGPKTELRISPVETIASVAPRGLQFVRQAEVPPYHYVVIFRR
jgi:ubiquinone/menaquinone biosynthesis C-methylase UbiE